MGMLRNPKYEAFAQRLARGEPILASYVLVGYKKKAQNASRLAKHDDIRARVDEILMRKDESFGRAEAKAITNDLVDKKWVMKRLVYEAEKGEQSSARCKALELVGKEMGMFVNRTEHGTPGSFETLDTTQAILDAVKRELGDDAAKALGALLERKAPKVIEHQVIESVLTQDDGCEEDQDGNGVDGA